jgi:hypothetical protein
MATSDSEDFESADEDLEIQIDHTELYSAKEQKEPEKYKYSSYELSDNRQKKNPDLLQKEIRSGDIYETSEDPHGDKTDVESLDIKNTAANTIENKADKLHSVIPVGGGSNVSVSDEAATKDRIKGRQPRKCANRQQKPREPKSGGSVRKLGTKISPAVLHTGLESEPEKAKQEFRSSEKSEKTSNHTVVGTEGENKGKTVTVSRYKMEDMEQDVRKLSLDESSERDIAPVLDKLSQSASKKVCKSNL